MDIRPLRDGDHTALLGLFQRVPEEDLYRVAIELVPEREDAAIGVVESMGFTKVATFKWRIRDYYGSYKDIAVLEIPLSNRSTWWKE